MWHKRAYSEQLYLSMLSFSRPDTKYLAIWPNCRPMCNASVYCLKISQNCPKWVFKVNQPIYWVLLTTTLKSLTKLWQLHGITVHGSNSNAWNSLTSVVHLVVIKRNNICCLNILIYLAEVVLSIMACKINLRILKTLFWIDYTYFWLKQGKVSPKMRLMLQKMKELKMSILSCRVNLNLW